MGDGELYGRPVIHMAWQAAHEHTTAAVMGFLSWLGGTAVMFAQVIGVEVSSSVIVGVALFISGTLTTFLGWLAVVVVRATQVLSRLETTAEDHERRLTSGGI